MLPELATVKREIPVTWDDPETDARIESLMEDAELTLNFKLGAECDYSAPGQIRRLFFNYIRYGYHDCLDDFDKAYMDEIYQIRRKIEVMQNEKDTNS